ncbi:MAG: Rieske 2Fe-2S domain-containing protein [Parvularculaceae bacterium]
MGATYKAVQWNGNKIVYDLYVLAALAVFIGVFMGVGLMTHPSGHTADPVVLLIRALGSAAFLMLTIVLSIGPLARLSPRFLPMLYNRRHLGVMTFLVASAHFALALFWYHGAGPLNPFVSLLVSNPLYDSAPGFPFEAFGLAAFAVLFLLAATSHDFWLNNLSAPLWKALHMLLYPAYGLLVLHVAFGALMTEKSPLYPALMAISLALVSGLHLFAGAREWRRDSGMKGVKAREGWIDVCDPADIPDGRAVIAPLPRGDRVAVFRKGARIHAIDNACRHQNGPLGEGCLKDGLVTCPWHGWQYRLEDGVSPPPYSERVATHDVRLTREGRVTVRVRKNPLGQAGAFIDLEAAP